MKNPIPTKFLFAFCILVIYVNKNANSLTHSLRSQEKNSFNFNALYTIPPMAFNDTFTVISGCNTDTLSGNILENDFDPNGDEIELYFCHSPKIGEFVINKKGDFKFIIPDGYSGTLSMDYYIEDKSPYKYKDLGRLIIHVFQDYDCDGVFDENDLDDDNDGLLDSDEGNGEVDSDLDGIPDTRDIDSDNDGITDNTEWQREGGFTGMLDKDVNKNGWDDAYDNGIKGVYYPAEDTDSDGIPDYIDTDSDEDGITDLIEGTDMNNDGIQDVNLLNCDTDKDGLDNGFDTLVRWNERNNPTGSSSSLPDLNKNGIRDWREFKSEEPENLFLTNEIVIYPNPTFGNFNIYLPDFNNDTKTFFSLYTLNGALIEQVQLTSNQNSLDIDVEKGVYIAKINSDKYNYSQSFIIR